MCLCWQFKGVGDIFKSSNCSYQNKAFYGGIPPNYCLITLISLCTKPDAKKPLVISLRLRSCWEQAMCLVIHMQLAV